MKRLNPNTGTSFKRGDLRDDGKMFYAYRTDKKRLKNGFFTEDWVTKELLAVQVNKAKNRYDSLMCTKHGHIKSILRGIKNRAKERDIPFSLTLEHLISIAPDNCPVFNEPLTWSQRHGKTANRMSPSVDRIVPNLGYVEGNVRWISYRANMMKNDASEKELIQFAKWVMT